MKRPLKLETVNVPDGDVALALALGVVSRLSQTPELNRRLELLYLHAQYISSAMEGGDEVLEKGAQLLGDINKLTNVERNIFWGRYLGERIGRSEEENGDIPVGIAAMENLQNFSQWNYSDAIAEGETPAGVANILQWVPTPWMPQAQEMVGKWVATAPAEKHAEIYKEMAGELFRLDKATQWNGGIRKAAVEVAKAWDVKSQEILLGGLGI